MKIISKKDAVRILIILAILVILVWILDPTPLVKWRTEKHAKALYSSRYTENYPWHWKVFSDMGKLIERKHHEIARSILDSAYMDKSNDYRLNSTGLDILLDISANILRSLPMNSVLVIDQIDDIHPFWFVQIAEGIRPDVILLNREFWNVPQYRKFLWNNSAIEDVISKNEFIGNDNNIAKILRRLSQKFPLFFTCKDCNIIELSENSLYRMPIIGYMYIPKKVSDTSVAELKYTMLFAQNWNLVCENPPIDDKQMYYNTKSSELAYILSDVANDLIKTGQDSLAHNILEKFDKWMSWEPYYLVMRADIARKLGDDPKLWFGKAQNWLDNNKNHWNYSIIRTYYDSVKSVLDTSTMPQSSGKSESKQSHRKNIRRRK